jgi:hypothetical protein
MIIRKLFAVFFLVATLPGCFYNVPDYPEGWAKLLTGSGCPELNGWYSDKGRAYLGARFNPSIYLIILGGSVSDMDDAEYLRITQSDDQIRLETYSASRSLMNALSFRIGVRTCTNGFLKLDVPDTDEFLSQEGVVSYEAKGHSLAKSADGALILRVDSTAVGFALAIPAASKDRIWIRFEAVKP